MVSLMKTWELAMHDWQPPEKMLSHALDGLYHVRVGKTMLGDLPPSSSITGLNIRPASSSMVLLV